MLDSLSSCWAMMGGYIVIRHRGTVIHTHGSAGQSNMHGDGLAHTHTTTAYKLDFEKRDFNKSSTLVLDT